MNKKIYVFPENAITLSIQIESIIAFSGNILDLNHRNDIKILVTLKNLLCPTLQKLLAVIYTIHPMF